MPSYTLIQDGRAQDAYHLSSPSEFLALSSDDLERESNQPIEVLRIPNDDV